MPIFQDNKELLGRLRWVRAGFLLVFLLFFAQLWSLAVLRFEYFRDLAERNHVRTFPQLAPRGLIYDREGRVIVDNDYGFDLLLFREGGVGPVEVEDFLVKELELDRQLLESRLEAARSYPIYQPVVVKQDLTLEEVAFLMAHQAEHPELGILRQPRRLYRYGGLAAHLLGYVGEISSAELAEEEFAGHRPGDLVGKYGIERTFNDQLRGQDGRRRVMVDSRGESQQEIERIDPKTGTDLTLTMDLDLQQIAEAELGEDPGAVIALDPQSGEVLAMASRPTFDPTAFARRLSHREWMQLKADPDSPMHNRATQSSFSPGSIFKVVMALAGLELGIIDESSSVVCTGSAVIYGNSFDCWKAGGHGRVTLKEAIQHSCNVYFYRLGQRLSINQIAHFSRRLGLGQAVGLETGAEAVGLVPSEEWKLRTRGEPWFPGETISVSIGQGPILATPLQLARAMAIVATGRWPALTLALNEDNAPPEPLVRAAFDSRHLELLRDAMWRSVNEGGTARAARVSGFGVCGKTGTAQTISKEGLSKLSGEAAAHFAPNAWFVGFGPRRDPRLVVAVIVQRGGGGGSAAAPIAGKIFRAYSGKYGRERGEPVEMASLRKGRTL